MLRHVDAARAEVLARADAERRVRVDAELATIDVTRLGELTDRNLRVHALRAAGYATAKDVLDAGPERLDAVPGVGVHTARGVVAAAEQLAGAIGGAVRLRIDLRSTGPLGLDLVRALARVDHLGPVEPHRRALSDYVSAVEATVPAAAPAANALTFALRLPVTRRRARSAVQALAGWDRHLAETGLADTVVALAHRCGEPDPGPTALWADFERRSAAYYALLGELVPWLDDAQAAAGLLPDELAERIRAYPLDTSRLAVRLRGYQEFGAQFLLNQGRAILGDEMGLGKTVQAIAALCHLAAAGEHRFLVVCPASVLVGWAREVRARSDLPVHILHGARRDEAMRVWSADGGVAVTTFDSLHHVPPAEVGMLVLDEAHLVKNPATRRARAVAAWTERCWRVAMLTGTPMENRLEEFTTLVRYLQPDLADAVPRHAGLAGQDAFRAAVAPVYLRRNQADVLLELPDVVVVDEWEQFTPAGAVRYDAAVAAGNLMAMRRADFTTPDPRDSAKLERLAEIVAEAAENGHKTVVFSYFRDVLDRVTEHLRDLADVHGPLTGDTPPTERQGMVDAFTDAAPGAVLVSQVRAGGTGLNIQAASVVVLTEPQLTPTDEAQAIARVHRMGQVRTVQVHRLLVEDSVDERLEELLAAKRRLFDDYVRDSALAQRATAAVDVSEADLARRLVAAEQERRGIGPVWDELALSE